MNRETMSALRLDRRLLTRRDWVDEGELTSALEALPDVSHKIAPPEEIEPPPPPAPPAAPDPYAAPQGIAPAAPAAPAMPAPAVPPQPSYTSSTYTATTGEFGSGSSDPDGGSSDV